MNNEPEQPVEAQSSESEIPSITKLALKNEHILARLINDLHNLILVLIAAVYYFDCFSLLFLLRFLGQNQITTAGIRIVATTNLICILTHIFHSITQPEPREIWNHGGILVDFVGEKPASRFKLLAYDTLIVGLQILQLALYYKKLTLDATTERETAAPIQDIEAEEAGISRANPPANIETDEGIEMQSLLPEGSKDEESKDARTPLDDTTIILRKKDFKEVFLNTAANAQTEESSAVAVRRFIDRVNTIRARRAELEARAATGTATATNTPATLP